MEKETKLLLTEAVNKMRDNGAPVIVGATHKLSQANNGKTSEVHFISSSNGALSAFNKSASKAFAYAKLENEPHAKGNKKAASAMEDFANLANKEIANFNDACDCKHALVLSTPEINPATGKETTGRTVTILASNDFEALYEHVMDLSVGTALVNHADSPADRTALVDYSCVVDGKIAGRGLRAEAYHPTYDFRRGNALNIDLIGYTVMTTLKNAHEANLEADKER